MPEQLFDDPESSEPEDHDVFYDAPDPDEPGDGPPADSAADVLVTALFEAGPEAAEHLLKAAQELLLAAKAVVDAGERVVEQHKLASEGHGEPGADDAPRVRRIDLA
ncbi:MAG: hypothetical protein H0V95_08400 [Actinobacteria bacterium]|nr:hypothetical protein [Actinomycetota bacterium]